MKKTALKSHKQNGHGPKILPADLSPALVQAVFEDAVMEAAADIAALSATLDAAALPEETVLATITPETREEKEILDLLSVPLLGPTRVQALAAVGILTLDDLRAATADQIGGAKGVGLGNAARIKDWLEAQVVSPPEPPPAPPSLPDAPPSFDPALAASNQAVFDELSEIDQAVTRLCERLGTKGQPKKLARQIDKLGTVTSELAEGPDTLSAKRLAQALPLLHKIADLLGFATEEKRLSPKKLEILTENLRARRKSLQKTIGE